MKRLISVQVTHRRTQKAWRRSDAVFLYYFMNRANTAKNPWTTCDIIFKIKTDRTRSDQELSNGKSQKPKEKGRKKEEDSKIEEDHDKLLL